MPDQQTNGPTNANPRQGRTSLASLRTQLALDRTTLAWIRTTLSLLLAIVGLESLWLMFGVGRGAQG